MMPSLWRLEHGELVLTSERPLTICVLSLRAEVAPRLNTLRAYLRQAITRPGLTVLLDDPDQSIWAWPGGPGLRQVLTISAIPASPDQAPERQGVSLSFAVDPIPAPDADRE